MRLTKHHRKRFLGLPSWLGALVLLVSSCAGTDCTRSEPAAADRTNWKPAAVVAAALGPATADRSSQPPPLPAAPLSIDQAVAFALAHNPDLDMAAARIRQADAQIDQAEAAFWPALGLYTSSTRGDSPSAYFFSRLDQRNFSFATDFNDPGTFRNFESGATLRWNLFNGGRDLLGHELARTGRQLRELEAAGVRNALAHAVIRACTSFYTAHDYRAIADQAVATVSAQLEDTRIRYQGGSALKSEWLSLEARLAEVEAERIQADSQQQAALAALANLLGQDADTRVRLAEAAWQPPQLPPDVSSGLLAALATRPELAGARRQVYAARLSAAREQAGYLPNLDLEARSYADSENLDYSTDRANWTVGLMLRWDLFTGLSTRARTRQAQAALTEMQAADRKAVQAVQLDVKHAYLGLAEARARLQAAQSGRLQAEEALRLVQLEYAGGSASIVRYLEAELMQHRARLTATRARYDLSQAEANVARALGYFAGPPAAAADASAAAPSDRIPHGTATTAAGAE